MWGSQKRTAWHALKPTTTMPARLLHSQCGASGCVNSIQQWLLAEAIIALGSNKHACGVGVCGTNSQ